MGIFTDFVASARTFPAVSPTAEKTRNYGVLQNDPADASVAAANEVQSIAHDATIDGGTFTLSFTGLKLNDGSTVNFTTGNLSPTSTAANVVTAINAASPATVADGDIAVTGGNISTADFVITFSGNTVKQINQPLVILNSSLVASATPKTPVVSQTTAGGSQRAGWSILKALGVITDSAPAQGVALVVTPGPNLLLVQPWYVKAVAREIAEQDGNGAAVYAAILQGLGMSDTQGQSH